MVEQFRGQRIVVIGFERLIMIAHDIKILVFPHNLNKINDRKNAEEVVIVNEGKKSQSVTVMLMPQPARRRLQFQ